MPTVVLLAVFLFLISGFLAFQNYRGFFAHVSFYFLGYFLFDKENKYFLRNQTNYSDVSVARVKRILKDSDTYVQLKVSVFDLASTHLFEAILFVNKSKDSIILWPGDVLLSQTRFQPIEDVTIPYAFSPSQYYKSKGISHTGFLNEAKVLYIEKNGFLSPYRPAWFLNRRLVESILQWPGDSKAKEILIALISGTKDFLSEDVRTTYSDTGIIHVLAVSGLHTGLIYVLMSWILNFVMGHRMPFLKSGIIILSLWFYALLTGFSPSVIRAATMFSFIQIGQSLKRKTGIYHSLAISAVTILTFHPFLLFEIGFQLSYSAVLGIVMLSDKLYNMLSFSNQFVLDKITRLLSVSIAAQLFTVPFSMYYFSQFPTYFFIANIFAIPIVTLVIYVGFPLALFCSVLPQLSPLGIIPVWLIQVNTYLAECIQLLPLSVVKGIFISPFQFFLLIILVFMLSLSLIYRKKNYLFTGLLLILFLQITQIFHHLVRDKYILKIGLFSYKEEPLLILKSGSKMSIFSKYYQQLKKGEKLYLSKFKIMEKIDPNLVDFQSMSDLIQLQLSGERQINLLTKDKTSFITDNSIVINLKNPEQSYAFGTDVHLEIRKSNRNSYWILVF
jgi:competence protein ComEC